MSYLVLARKYRPKVFADMVGQEHVVRPLANALASGRIAHAYLFAGARGVGKTTVARLLAMALNCRVDDRPRPCGECASCQEIGDGQAVDVFEIDGASNRGINEIRELRETVKYLPSKGEYKVYIIDEVHMLTKEAFNALLKTLEEPPEHVVFIFATTEAHKVLPTILSRCQRYDFKRIGLRDIVGRLEEIARAENIQADPGALRLIARESEGGLRDALSLLDQVIAYAGMTVSDQVVAEALGLIDQTLIADMAAALLAGDAGRALDILDVVYNYGFDTKDFAGQLLNYFRSLVVAKVTREPDKILDVLDTELTDLQQTAARFSLETLNFHFNAWLDVQDRLHRSTQPRMVLEALVVRLAQVEPLLPLAELTAKLEALLGPAGRPSAAGQNKSEPFSPPSPPASPSAQTAPPSVPAPSGDQTQSGAADRGDDPASVPATAAETNDWQAFLNMAREESPLLPTMLGRGEIRAFGPDRVEIVFGPKNGADLVRDRLPALLAKFFKTRPRLEIRVSEDVAAANGNQGASGAADQETLKEQILNHPLVQEARQILSGEVVEIKPEK